VIDALHTNALLISKTSFWRVVQFDTIPLALIKVALPSCYPDKESFLLLSAAKLRPSHRGYVSVSITQTAIPAPTSGDRAERKPSRPTRR
jgi:hypothetical protein